MSNDEITLRQWYWATYRPSLRLRVTHGRVAIYDRAVDLMEAFAGRDLAIGDVTEVMLSEFITKRFKGRKGIHTEKHRRELAGHVRSIVRDWNPAALVSARDRSDVADEPLAPQSLRQHFESVYLPQEMFDKQLKSQESTRNAIRRLDACFGRPVLLGEISDKIAADFFRNLLAQNYPATTVNNFRRHIFSVWRHAHRLGLTPAAPGVKRLRENREAPEAWSLQEFARILDAAGRLPCNGLYGPVPTSVWWTAILNVAYWTGLRRGSLLKIQHGDIDLKKGWLLVPASHIKTKRAKRFFIPPSAMTAIRRVVQLSGQKEGALFEPHPSTHSTYRTFDRILKVAEVPPSTRKGLNKFHKIRRTVATAAYEAGGVAAAAALLDHSDPNVTLTHYVDGRARKDNDATLVLPVPQLKLA